MAKPSNDFADVAPLLESLATRGFWGSVRFQFQEGALMRCVLEESVKLPKQLMKNGQTGHYDDNNQR